ncbi:hypothetical protein J2T12_001002 [Paenibacillus anaericanus]|uniref:HNH endonuclease n=1 Tax=Paenibacillus anaericanus TaxID=170367 RepID=UPI00278B2DB9|nr:EVE domain-containing protein [Paenibacillus anaericanus]MDQ0087608.1 hypothetical protein [Paenibacillus anaericanus]
MATWIFQGNPTDFDVDNYIRDNEVILWSLRQKHYSNQINIGDVVYLWRSDGGRKGTGGIIAKCVVIIEPKQLNDDAQKYWISITEDTSEIRITLKVLEFRLNSNHIYRHQLLEHEELSSLRILKLRQNTNYLLTDEQATLLEELWDSLKTENVGSSLPIPEPVLRSREYEQYNDEQRSNILIEYLLRGHSHRWIDEHVLGLDVDSRGYQSMGVLHHLGLKNVYKGIFKGLTVSEAVELLRQEVSLNQPYSYLYEPVIRLLNLSLGLEMSSRNGGVIAATALDETAVEYPEGKIAYILHRRRERNPIVIKRAKELFVKKHGKLYCEVCCLDFTAVYGERGKDFIEGHHKKLISEMRDGETTKVDDIAMLCSNCHRMIHRKPLISVEELAVIVNQSRL